MLKKILLLCLTLVFFACQEDRQTPAKDENQKAAEKIDVDDLPEASGNCF